MLAPSPGTPQEGGTHTPAASTPHRDLPCLTEKNFAGRAQVHGFTIDPLGCKDHDDALGIRFEGRDRIIDISIADVAELIKPGTALDADAFSRSFSRYDPGAYDPMLPVQLSDDELSIRTLAARPTVTVSVPFNSRGMMGRPEISLTYIQCAANLDYEGVDYSIAHGSGRRAPELIAMREIAALLLQLRGARGALVAHDLKRGILSDEDGHIRVLGPDHVNSHLIVQEFMILTNEVIANRCAESGTPILYRNHSAREGVDSDLVQAYMAKATALGGAALESHLAGMGRFVYRARYAAENKGHFALSLPAYTHFTSPIRRYPDLVNARQLRALLAGDPLPYSADDIRRIGEHATAIQHSMKDERRFRAAAANGASPDQIHTGAGESNGTSISGTASPSSNRREPNKTDVLRKELGRAEPDAEVVARISREIAAQTITTSDLAKILFLSVSVSQAWQSLREQAINYLGLYPEHVPSVLTSAQITMHVEFKTTLCGEHGLDHSRTFGVSGLVSGRGKEGQGAVVFASTKRGAERLALLSGLRAWIGLSPELPPQAGPPVLTLDGATAPRPLGSQFNNPIGMLNDLIMAKRGFRALEFADRRKEAPDRHALFGMTASIALGETVYSFESQPVSTKAGAKRDAAVGLLLKLQEAGVLEVKPANASE